MNNRLLNVLLLCCAFLCLPMAELAAQCDDSTVNAGSASNCNNFIDINPYMGNSSCEMICANTSGGSDEHGGACSTGDNSVWLSFNITSATLADGSFVLAMKDYPGTNPPVVAAYLEAAGTVNNVPVIGQLNLNINCTQGFNDPVVDGLISPPWLLDGAPISIPGSDPIPGLPCFSNDNGDQTFYDTDVLFGTDGVESILDAALGAGNSNITEYRVWLQIEADAAGQVCFEISNYASGSICGDPNMVNYNAGANPGMETQTVSDCLCNSALNGSLTATASSDPAGQCAAGEDEDAAVWYQVNADYSCNTIEAEVTNWAGNGDLTVSIVSNVNCPDFNTVDLLANAVTTPGAAVLGYTDEGSACLNNGLGGVTSTNQCLPPGDYWVVVSGVTDRDEFTMNITISEPCLDITDLAVNTPNGDVCSEGIASFTATTEGNVEFLYAPLGQTFDATQAYAAAGGATSLGGALSNGTVATNNAAGPLPQNTTCAIEQYNVYAIASPAPGDPLCRPFFGPVVVNVYPEIGASVVDNTVNCEITVTSRCPDFTVNGQVGTATIDTYVPGDNGTLGAFTVANGLASCDELVEPVISCAGNCAPPVVTAQVVCNAPGDANYFVDIDFTDLGDSPTYTVEDSDGSTLVVNATGIVQMGPYTNGSSIGIKVFNDFDPNCNVNLGQFTGNCVNCPNLVGAGAVGVIGGVCSGEVVNLLATLDPPGAVNGVDYAVQWQVDGVDIIGANTLSYNHTMHAEGCTPVSQTFTVNITCLNDGVAAVNSTVDIPVTDIYPVPRLGIDYGPQECTVLPYDNCGDLEFTITNGAVDPGVGTTATVDYDINVNGAPCGISGSYTVNCPDCSDDPGDGTTDANDLCWNSGANISNSGFNVSTNGFEVGLAVSTQPITEPLTDANLNTLADIGVFGPYDAPGDIDPAQVFINNGGLFPTPSDACGDTYYFTPFMSFSSPHSIDDIVFTESGNVFLEALDLFSQTPGVGGASINIAGLPFCEGLTQYDISFCAEDTRADGCDPFADPQLGQATGAGVNSPFPNINGNTSSGSGESCNPGDGGFYQQNGWTGDPNQTISFFAVNTCILLQSSGIDYTVVVRAQSQHTFPTVCESCNTAGDPVAVTFYPEMNMASVPAQASVCPNDVTDLTLLNPVVNGSGGVIGGNYTWYEGPSADGNPIADPTSVMTTQLTQYCVTFRACTETDACLPLEECFNQFVNGGLIVETPVPDPICPGDMVTLTDYESDITLAGGTFEWFIGDPTNGGAQIADPSLPITPIGTELYFAIFTPALPNFCPSVVGFSLSYHSLPTLAAVAPRVCLGDDIDLATFEATINADAGVFTWYDDDPLPYPPDVAGTALGSTVITPLDPLAAGFDPEDNEYWVQFVDDATGCVNKTNVIVNVDQLPILNTPTPAPLCAETEIDLTDQEAAIIDVIATPGTFVWYDADPNGGGSVMAPDGNGDILVTPDGTETYFVEFTETATTCESSVNFGFTVNPLPTSDDIGSPFSLCADADPIDLTALESDISGGEANISYAWYLGTDASGTLLDNDGVPAGDDPASQALANGSTTDFFAVITNTLTTCTSTAAVQYTVFDLVTGATASYDCDLDQIVVDLSGATGGSGSGYTVSLSSPNSDGETIAEDTEFEIIVADDQGCVQDTITGLKDCEAPPCDAEAGNPVAPPSTICFDNDVTASIGAVGIPADAMSTTAVDLQYVYAVTDPNDDGGGAAPDGLIVGFSNDGSYTFEDDGGVALPVGTDRCFYGLIYDQAQLDEIITLNAALLGAFGITPGTDLPTLFGALGGLLGPLDVPGALAALDGLCDLATCPDGFEFCYDVVDQPFCVEVVDCNCTPPTATFTAHCGSDPIDPAQYFIDVNITDMGSGNATYAITNNGGVAAVAGAGLGVTTIGPFAYIDGTTVISVTVTGEDDSSCLIQGNVTEKDCNCPAVAGTPDNPPTSVCFDEVTAPSIPALGLPPNHVPASANSVFSYLIVDPNDDGGGAAPGGLVLGFSDDGAYTFEDENGDPLPVGAERCFYPFVYDKDYLDAVTCDPGNAATLGGFGVNCGDDLASLLGNPILAGVIGPLDVDGALAAVDGLCILLACPNFDFCFDVSANPVCVTVDNCSGCTPPAVSYSTNCIDNDNFEVLVDITALGSSATYTISDDQGTTSMTGVNATGMVSFGSYAHGTNVVVTVESDDDAACNVSSNTLTYNDATVSFTTECIDDDNFRVVVEVTDMGSNSDYTISDDQATASSAVGATGTFNYGSYANGTNVIVTLGSDDDTGCDIVSDVLTDDCTPPCEAPTVSFSTVCLTGSTFGIVVDITALGNAPDYDISDDQGTTAQTVNAAGQVTYGSYANGTDVVVTVADGNGDTTCDVVSNTQTADCSCSAPIVEFDTECIDDNTFRVVVNVIALGSSPLPAATNAYTISDDQGTATTAVTATGIFNYGTYSNNTIVNVTLESDDDSACDTGSGDLTTDCTPAECTLSTIGFGTNCLDDGSFEVRVGVKTIGNASSYTISDDQGTTPINFTTADNYSFGTYPENTFVTITVTDNDDGACTIISGALTANCGDACVEPTVTFTTNCLDDNTFEAIANVTNLGSGTTYTLSDDQGSAAVAVNATGAFNIGAYANGTNVNLTFTSLDDALCSLSSNTLTADCTPAPCSDPEAVFTVVCNGLGTDYFIDVNITAGAGTYTITNDGGAASVNGAGLGVTQIGPFAYVDGTVLVNVVVTDESDGSCSTANTLAEKDCIECDAVAGNPAPLNPVACFIDAGTPASVNLVAPADVQFPSAGNMQYIYIVTDPNNDDGGSAPNGRIVDFGIGNYDLVDGGGVPLAIGDQRCFTGFVYDQNQVDAITNDPGNVGLLALIGVGPGADLPTIFNAALNSPAVAPLLPGTDIPGVLSGVGGLCGVALQCPAGLCFDITTQEQCVTITDCSNLPCTEPDVTFSTNCIDDNTFEAVVTINSLGSSASYTLSDNQGTAAAGGITAVGAYPYGIYANGANVIVTIESDDDAACDVSSGTLTDNCTPPPCQDPLVAFGTECIDDNNFAVTVVITGVGLPDNYTITDDQGTTAAMVSGLGSHLYGTYANGTVVNATLNVTGYVNCDSESGPLSTDCAPPSGVCSNPSVTFATNCLDDDTFEVVATISTLGNAADGNPDTYNIMDDQGSTPIMGVNAAGSYSIGVYSNGTNVLVFVDNPDESCGVDSDSLTDDCTPPCESPDVTFEAVCDDNDEDNFYVTVNISGGNGSYTISNDANANTQAGNAGDNTVGPFANDADVVITVEFDGDASCDVVSNTLTNNCAPPPCEAPDVTFEAVCDDGDTDNFYVTVNISGGNGTYTIINTGNLNTQVGNAGDNTVGPFANGSSIIVVVEYDGDETCDVTSNALGTNCDPNACLANAGTAATEPTEVCYDETTPATLAALGTPADYVGGGATPFFTYILVDPNDDGGGAAPGGLILGFSDDGSYTFDDGAGTALAIGTERCLYPFTYDQGYLDLITCDPANAVLLAGLGIECGATLADLLGNPTVAGLVGPLDIDGALAAIDGLCALLTCPVGVDLCFDVAETPLCIAVADCTPVGCTADAGTPPAEPIELCFDTDTPASISALGTPADFVGGGDNPFFTYIIVDPNDDGGGAAPGGLILGFSDDGSYTFDDGAGTALAIGTERCLYPFTYDQAYLDLITCDPANAALLVGLGIECGATLADLLGNPTVAGLVGPLDIAGALGAIDGLCGLLTCPDGVEFCFDVADTPLCTSIIDCVTCDAPEVSFSTNCIDETSFEIIVEVTAVGSATTYTIGDDQATATTDFTTVGSYSYGTYTNNTEVVITITNDEDGACDVSSETLSTDCTPPPCVPPVVTFSTSCIDEESFEVIVEVTALGTALTYTIGHDLGAESLDIDAVGTYSFGSYANNTEVTITFNNEDDAECNLTSDVLSADCFIPCTEPVVQFYANCLDDNTYEAVVNIITLGNAGSYTISDDLGTPAITVGATGMYGFGNYSNNTSVTITLADDDDAICNTVSQDLSTDCTPPPCEAPEIEFGTTCISDTEFTLQVTVVNFGSADNYTLSDDQGGVPVLLTSFGTFSYGNYANGSTVVATVSNAEDADCNVTSTELTDDCTDFCIAPSVSFEAICDEDSDGFYVMVDVEELGTSGAYVLTDNQGTIPQAVSSVSSIVFGVYPAGTEVVINVSGNDEDCDVMSDVLSPDCIITGDVVSSIFVDENGNGLRDGDEGGLAGVMVTMIGDGFSEDTFTDGDGNFSFLDIPEGEYYFVVTLPDGYQFVIPNAGSDDVDSEVDPATGETPPFNVGEGLNEIGVSAGIELEPVDCSNFSIEYNAFCTDESTQNGEYFVEFTIIGGTAPYTGLAGSDITGDIPGGTAVILGPLPDGTTFNLLIADADACEASASETPDPCTKSCDELVLEVEAVCTDESTQNGEYFLEIIVSTGNAPYSVSINGGIPFDILNDGELVTAGPYPDGQPYNVVVTDLAGCPASAAGTPVPCTKVCDDLVIDHLRICPTPEDGTYEVVYTIIGGSYPFSVSGDVNLTINEGEDLSFTVQYTDGDPYGISLIDGGGCAAAVAESPLSCAKLSVELIEFSGIALTKANQLTWVTGSETDNDYFILERSADGINFETIAEVNGAGNSTSELTYVQLDENPLNGVSYYRLKQVDLDGTLSLIPQVVTLVRGDVELNITSIYPVPASELLNIEFTTAEEGSATIQVFDVLGRQVVTKLTPITAGLNNYQLELNNYPVGAYFLILNDGTKESYTKFIKE